MYVKKEKIYHAYVSKINSNREKQVIIFIISNREKREAKSEGRLWHYLAVKKLSALLREINSEHHGGFYCLHSFETEKKLESHKKVCKNDDFCNIIMPSEDSITLDCDIRI